MKWLGYGYILYSAGENGSIDLKLDGSPSLARKTVMGIPVWPEDDLVWGLMPREGPPPASQ